MLLKNMKMHLTKRLNNIYKNHFILVKRNSLSLANNKYDNVPVI